jgi:hypothetical protein
MKEQPICSLGKSSLQNKGRRKLKVRFDELRHVLLETIKIDHKLDWEATRKQHEIPIPAAPKPRPIPTKPDVTDLNIGLLFSSD